MFALHFDSPDRFDMIDSSIMTTVVGSSLSGKLLFQKDPPGGHACVSSSLMTLDWLNTRSIFSLSEKISRTVFVFSPGFLFAERERDRFVAEHANAV